MSKHHRTPFSQPSNQVKIEPKTAENEAVSVENTPVVPRKKSIPEWEQCPICYHGRGGVGLIYGEYPPKSRKYYRCNECGHTWTAVLRTEAVEIDHRMNDISTR